MIYVFKKRGQLALIKQQQINKVKELGIPDEVQQIHRVLPGSKGEGIIHLIYENVNRINNKLFYNKKVQKAKEIHDNLEVDIVAYNEHRLNMRHRLNVNGFNQLFRWGN
jgi:hypothetical protein